MADQCEVPTPDGMFNASLFDSSVQNFGQSTDPSANEWPMATVVKEAMKDNPEVVIHVPSPRHSPESSKPCPVPLLPSIHPPTHETSARAWRVRAARAPPSQVGDYLYTQGPCPSTCPGGSAGSCCGTEENDPVLGGPCKCAEGYVWGDNWDTMVQEFLYPARPLLEAAPWILARGDHEQ